MLNSIGFHGIESVAMKIFGTESKDAVYYNYFGWTWFAMSWMSVK